MKGTEVKKCEGFHLNISLRSIVLQSIAFVAFCVCNAVVRKGRCKFCIGTFYDTYTIHSCQLGNMLGLQAAVSKSRGTDLVKATFTELSAPSLLFRCICCCCSLYLMLASPVTAVTPVLTTGQTGQKECFSHWQRMCWSGIWFSVKRSSCWKMSFPTVVVFFSSLYIFFNLSIQYYFMIGRLGMALKTWACLSICTSSFTHRYRPLGILQAFFLGC